MKTDELFHSPWNVYFSDGSGNGYNFFQEDDASATQFSYEPVQPKFSSSGTYSGGNAQTGVLQKATSIRLQQLIIGLGNAEELHGPNPRPMGSGYFKLHLPTEKLEFVIVASEELREFNAFVKSCRE